MSELTSMEALMDIPVAEISHNQRHTSGAAELAAAVRAASVNVSDRNGKPTGESRFRLDAPITVTLRHIGEMKALVARDVRNASEAEISGLRLKAQMLEGSLREGVAERNELRDNLRAGGPQVECVTVPGNVRSCELGTTGCVWNHEKLPEDVISDERLAILERYSDSDHQDMAREIRVLRNERHALLERVALAERMRDAIQRDANTVREQLRTTERERDFLASLGPGTRAARW